MTTNFVSPSLPVLFEHFLKEKQYLQNVAPCTVKAYAGAFRAFALGNAIPTQAGVNNAVISLRESGKTARCINVYARNLNSFLSWLYENEYTAERVRIKKLKCADVSLKTFSDEQVQRLLAFKPRKKSETRLYALLILLTDSGCRINEALNLRRKDVDFENCLIDIVGKGGRFRRVPISLACRKVLFKHLNTHNHDLVFCSRDGTKLIYNNLHRDFVRLCARLNISDFDGGFHSFRRYFITFAARKNVNPFVIMRLAGHSQITTTQKYLKLQTVDLQQAHVSALQAVGGAR
jgi:integrase/recombinase XerD